LLIIVSKMMNILITLITAHGNITDRFVEMDMASAMF
jgi:hypothetical protein